MIRWGFPLFVVFAVLGEVFALRATSQAAYGVGPFWPCALAAVWLLVIGVGLWYFSPKSQVWTGKALDREENDR